MDGFDLERHWPWILAVILIADTLVIYRVARKVGARAGETGRGRLVARVLLWSIPVTWLAVALLLWIVLQ